MGTPISRIDRPAPEVAAWSASGQAVCGRGL